MGPSSGSSAGHRADLEEASGPSGSLCPSAQSTPPGPHGMKQSQCWNEEHAAEPGGGHQDSALSGLVDAAQGANSLPLAQRTLRPSSGPPGRNAGTGGVLVCCPGLWTSDAFSGAEVPCPELACCFLMSWPLLGSSTSTPPLSSQPLWGPADCVLFVASRYDTKKKICFRRCVGWSFLATES